jgi:hypothetical protein
MATKLQIHGSTQIRDNTVTIEKLAFDLQELLTREQARIDFITTENQTTFNNAAFLPTMDINVYKNGMLLNPDEYTVNIGSIVLTEATIVSEIVTIFFGTNALIPANNINTQLLLKEDLANKNVANGYAGLNSEGKINTSQLPYSTVLEHGAFNSKTLVTSTTANQVIDSFPMTTYRSAKYTIQATSGSEYHISEYIAIHNGTDCYDNEFMSLYTGDVELFTVDSNINGSNVELTVTPLNAATTFKVIITYILV